MVATSVTWPGQPVTLEFRKPTVSCAKHVWRLVRESGALDENSCYAYLLLCRDFGETCVVAHDDLGVAGFVTAYRPPDRRRVLFVWQVGVASRARRRGIGQRMLRHLLERPACHDVQFVEATVTPSNAPSRRLFAALARQLDCDVKWTAGFSEEDFGGSEHESEPLLRIGPIDRPQLAQKGTP